VKRNVRAHPCSSECGRAVYVGFHIRDAGNAARKWSMPHLTASSGELAISRPEEV